MPKYLSVLLAGLLLSLASFAQTRYDEQPIDERDVCFQYAEFGLPNSDALKVVVFTSYIYRYKYDYGYDHPVLHPDSWRTMLTNAFRNKVKKIEADEYNTSATNQYNQVSYKPHSRIEWAYKNSVHANGTGPELYQTVTSATTFNANVRDRILSDYRAKGYYIFQVTFDDFYDDDIRKLRLEDIYKLSALEYETYRPGAIKALARRYQENSGGSVSYPALTIEDSGSSSTNKKSNSGSGSGSESKTDDDSEDWKLQAAINQMNAEALEAEGDRLYKLGTMFYMQALQKYQEAQRLYPTPRVQARVDEINAYVALGKAVNAMSEQIDKGVESLDPEKKTRNVFGFVNYTGLMGSYKKLSNPADQAPMEAFFGVTGHRILISFEVRMGYMVSPVYEYIVRTHDRNFGRDYFIEEKVRVQQSSLGLGMSGGLNLPLGSLVVYGLYGMDMMFGTLSQKVLTPGFSLDETPTYPWLINKWTLGTVYKIPKTGIGLGVQYNINSLKGEKDGASPIKYNKDPNGHYYLDHTTDEIYKFNNLGISFCWTL